MKNIWSKDIHKKAEVEALYAKGVRPSDIAREIGLPYSQVRDIIYKEQNRARYKKWLKKGANYKNQLAANKIRARRKRREASKIA